MPLKEYTIKIIAHGCLASDVLEKILRSSNAGPLLGRVKISRKRISAKDIPIEDVRPAWFFHQSRGSHHARGLHTLADLLKIKTDEPLYEEFTVRDFDTLNHWLQDHGFKALTLPKRFHG